jgi:hypothetical protein
MFRDRQLCVKQTQHGTMTRVTATIWRTRIESNYKFFPQTKKIVRYSFGNNHLLRGSHHGFKGKCCDVAAASVAQRTPSLGSSRV